MSAPISDHPCPECPYIAVSRRGLSAHRRIHNGHHEFPPRAGAAGEFAGPHEVMSSGPDWDGGVFSLGGWT